MGYTITIGNATPRPPDPSDAPGGRFSWGVDNLVLPEAPRHPNDANPGCNYRWPGYGVWAEFARAVSLYDILIDRQRDGTLMPSHPGIAPLYPWHRDRVRGALAAYRAKHPSAVARFSTNIMGGPGAEGATLTDAHLARLEWLDWWIDWAITNCAHPAIETG